MEELIKTFHIDWKLIIAQVINFAIVLIVLWRYALKPLVAIMDKRSKEIAKSLEDAHIIEENLATSHIKSEEMLLKAKKEALEIIESSRMQGHKQGQELVEKAKEEVNQVIVEAKNQIILEKEKMLKEVKTEVSGLAVASAMKILEEVAGEKLDEKIAAKVLSRTDL